MLQLVIFQKKKKCECISFPEFFPNPNRKEKIYMHLEIWKIPILYAISNRLYSIQYMKLLFSLTCFFLDKQKVHLMRFHIRMKKAERIHLITYIPIFFFFSLTSKNIFLEKFLKAKIFRLFIVIVITIKKKSVISDTNGFFRYLFIFIIIFIFITE